METNKRIKKRGQDLPSQEFNGKKYYLYNGERYFSKHNTRLHVVVWEFYNGIKVPKGFHVHHIDENTHNNDISNLEIIEGTEHLRMHGKKRVKENKEWFKEFHAKGIEKEKEWHASEEGIEWHRQHAIKNRFGNKTYGEGVCEECGETFIKKKKETHKLCSNKCKSRSRRRSGVDNVEANCIVCETVFIKNKYSKTKTCGDKNCTNSIRAGLRSNGRK